jgi:Cu-processing system ATP-binding protein
MIKFSEIIKDFGKLRALASLDLEISTPGICSILGPNGSGKTTLIKTLLGMVNPSSGSVLFDGNEIKNEWNYRKQISYLPQIAHFPANISGYDLIEMLKDIREQEADEGYFVDIFELKSHLTKKTSQLSGGTVQKLNITLALMFDSPVIILDEPSNGLDPVAMMHLKDIIKGEREKGKYVILISHIMSLVEELSDRIIFMNEGRIKFDGSVTELSKSYASDNLEESIANLLKEENVKNI